MPSLTLATPDSGLSALGRSHADLGRKRKLAAAIHGFGRSRKSHQRVAELLLSPLTQGEPCDAILEDDQGLDQAGIDACLPSTHASGLYGDAAP